MLALSTIFEKTERSSAGVTSSGKWLLSFSSPCNIFVGVYIEKKWSDIFRNHDHVFSVYKLRLLVLGYSSQDRVCNHIFKNLEVRPRYSAVRI